MTMDQMMYAQQPMTSVICQNMTDSVLVIASDPRRTHEVTFEGKGSPAGGDYQHMPREIIATPAFARQIALGTLRVVQGEDDPLVASAMQSQSDAFWKRAEADKAAALGTLDEVADNDYTVLTCIGPGTRPDAPCGENIPVKAAEANAKPPLCSRHENLAEQCVRRGSNPWVLEPS
jgi:hypothetical protein